MKFSTFKFLVLSDLYRISGNLSTFIFLKQILFGIGFKYNFWMRFCCYTETNFYLKYTLYPVSRIILRHLQFKFGIVIHPTTQIGSGFYVGHFGNIIVNSMSIIGKNCNISQGVTIGGGNRGKNKGYPILGDNVYIGPGAKIIGNVRIGNNVAIGANCVVTKDVPDNSVVVGIPGRVISELGSTDYINNTDYEDKINGQH